VKNWTTSLPVVGTKSQQNFTIAKHMSEIHMTMLYWKNRTTRLPVTIIISNHGFKVQIKKTYGNAVVEELTTSHPVFLTR
jgi:hypothetical protein